MRRRHACRWAPARRARLGRFAGFLTLAFWPLGACSVDDLFSSGGDAPPRDPGAVPQGPGGLAFTVQPGPSVVGRPITPAVEVTARDEDGNPATGFTGAVSMALENADDGTLTGETVRTAAAGVATFPGLAVTGPVRSYRLRATADGMAAAVSAEFAVSTQPPPTVTVVGGDGQVDTVAATLPQPCVIRVADDLGSPVSGVEVTWTVMEGNVLSADTRTDATGEARATHTLGTTAGVQQITAAVPQALGSPVACAATATPGMATELVFTQPPTDAAPNAVIAPPVVVTVSDQFGNAVVGFGESVEVEIVALTGTPFATLSGTLVRPATSGAATFDDLRIDLLGLGYRLRAFTGGLAVESPAFDIR